MEKKIWFNFWILLMLTGCGIQSKAFKDREFTVMYEFEPFDIGDTMVHYFYKSALVEDNNGVENFSGSKCKKGPSRIDLLEDINNRHFESLGVPLNEKFRIDCAKNLPSTSRSFSKYGNGWNPRQYSDYFYGHKVNDVKNVWIIFKVRGDFVRIRKYSKRSIKDFNRRYACPIVLNKLNLPFFVVTNLSETKPTDIKWLESNNFRKLPIDSILTNDYCH
jgi:hypothetical protein